jgi:putative ABC transport system ATP-binding protein
MEQDRAPAPVAARDPAPRAVEIGDLRFGWRPNQPVLDIARFELTRGERVFLRGPSGSGKSTLLGLISGVVRPQDGRVVVLGSDLKALSPSKRDALRAERIGVVFQMFNLVPYLSVLENILLPCRFSAVRRSEAASGRALDAEARRLISRLGLDHEQMAHRRVTDLSVGQQQRVAVARALIGGPELILADEPTSALDADARLAFIDLLTEECAERKASLLFVSHDVSLAERFDRTVDLKEINRASVTEPA